MNIIFRLKKKQNRWTSGTFSFLFFLFFATIANVGFATKDYLSPPRDDFSPPRFIELRDSLVGEVPETTEYPPTPPSQIVYAMSNESVNATSTSPESSNESINQEIKLIPRVPIAGNFVFKKVKKSFSADDDLTFELDMKKFFSLTGKEIGEDEEEPYPTQQSEENTPESAQKISENENDLGNEDTIVSASSTPDFSENENNNEDLPVPIYATSTLSLLEEHSSSTPSLLSTPLLLTLDEGVSSFIDDIGIELVDPQGNEFDGTVSLKKDGENLIIHIPHPAHSFKPGKYQLTIDVLGEDAIYVVNHEFTWGVLAINTNKSIYVPNETVYLQMAVLTDTGNTVCDANLLLKIQDTRDKIQTFSTEEGTIQYSGKCARNNVTNVPDYFAYYEVGEPGIYEMTLTNLDNGYEITDSFEVRDPSTGSGVPFDVERIGPTRIYPPANYEMKIIIKANEDFRGEVIERMPEHFEIANYEARMTNNGTVIHNSQFVIREQGNGEKALIVQVSLMKGDELALVYEFDAPDVSPEFYLLGPLTLQASSFTFQESRSWQIASDATLTWDGGGGVDTNWSTCANWSGDSCPGSADTAVFDATSTNNSTVDASFAGTIAVLNINAGYTGTITLSRSLTIAATSTDAYTQSAGTFNQSASTLNVAGNFTLNNGSTFTKSSNSSAFTLDGTGNLTDNNAIKQDLGAVTIGGTSTTRTLTTAIKMTSLTINSGNVFSLAGNNFDFSASAAVVNNGTFRLQGVETLTNVSNVDTDTGTVEYVGRNVSETITIKDFGATDYFHLTINDANATKANYTATAALALNGILTVSNANNVQFDSSVTGGSGQSISLTGIAGTLTVSGTMSIVSGAITLGATGNVSVALVQSSVGGGAISITSSSGNVTASNTVTTTSGAITIAAPGTISTATVQASSSGGAIKLCGNSDCTADATSITASNTITTTNGTITLRASGNISTATVQASSSGGAISITSSSGNITASNTITTTSGTITVVAPGTISTATVQASSSGGAINICGNSGCTTNATSITASDTITTSNGTITLKSTGNIDVRTVQASSSGGAISITADSGTFTTNANSVATTNGNITITADSISTGVVQCSSSGGTISLTTDVGSITASGTITTTNGSITLNSQTSVSVAAVQTTTTGGAISLTANAGSLTATGTMSTVAGNIGLTASGSTGHVDVQTVTPASGFNTNLSAGGNFTLSAGTFTRGAGTFTAAGNFTLAAATTFTKATGGQALTLDGTGNLTDNNTTKQDLGALVAGGTSTTRTLTTAAKMTGLTINSGDTFSLNGNNFDFSAAAAVVNNGTFRLQGIETLTNVNHLDTDTGTVEYVGRNVAETITLKDFGGTDYFNLTINDTNTNKATFSSGAAKSITGAFTVSSGTYNANGNSTTVTGLATVSGGTYQASTATQILNGGLTISSGTFTGSSGIVDVNGALTLSGGTLTAPSGNLQISGNFTVSGTPTFTHNSGTVTFDGTADQTFTTNAITLNNFTLNNTGAAGSDDIIILGNLDVNAALTITDGDLDVSTNDPNVNLAGDMTVDANGTIDNAAYTGTWTFDGSGTSTLTDNTAAGTNFRAITVDETSKVLQLAGSAPSQTFTTLTIGSDDTFSLNGEAVTMTTLVNNGTFRLQGGESVTLTTQDTDSGTWAYVGDGAGGTATFTIFEIGATDYYNLTLNSSAGDETFQSGAAKAIAGAFNVTAGSYNANGQTTITTGLATVNGGTYTASTATQTFDGGLTISSGTFTGSSGTVDVNGAFTQSGGTFTAPSTMSVTGDFTVSGTPTFTEGSGTITFDGGAATIDVVINETFNNLSINASSTKTVAASDTLIVSGTLTLTDGSLNQTTIPSSGTIAARGNITQASTFDGGTGSFVIDGTGSQTFTGGGSATAGDLPDVTINKSAGTLTLSSTIRTTNDWTYTQGTVDATTNDSTAVFAGTPTVDGQGTSATMAFDNVDIRGTTITLGGNLDVDGNLTITSGTLDVSGSNFSINVAGNWTNSGTFTARSGTLTVDGSTAQAIGGANQTTFNNVTLNNSSGLNLNKTMTISATLTFTSGNITATSTTVIISSGGSVSRTSGHVIGNLQKSVASGSNVSLTYEVGDATSYAPIALSFGSVTTSGTLTAKTTQGDHSDITNSAVIPSKSVNRYWTMTQEGLAFTNYSATFTFISADLDQGVDTSSLIIAKKDGATWTTPTVGTRSATSVQGTGMTSLSDFQLGQAPTVSFSQVSSSGSEATTSVSVAVSLSQSSNIQVTVDYSATGGTATGSGTDYTLADGTLTFSAGDTTKNITMTVTDDTLDENDETVIVTLSNPSSATLGSNTTHTYTITDNDEAAGGGADTTAPVITAVSSQPSKNSATITWTTNEAASSQVEYGTSVAYGSETTESDTSPRVASHSVSLSGLSICTTYHYRVKSTDASSNQATSPDNTFKTTGCGGGGASIEAFTKPKLPASILINSGDAITTSRAVTLTLQAGANVDRMALSHFPDLRDAVIEPYREQKQWTLTEGEGEKTVYVKFYTKGYGQASQVYFARIRYQKEVIPPLSPPPLIARPIFPPQITEPIIEFIKPFLPSVEITLPKISQIPKLIAPLLPEGLRSRLGEELRPTPIPIEEFVKREAPLALKGTWQLLPQEPIRQFVFAPLPRGIRVLTEKFPQLAKTFREGGVTKMANLPKLRGIPLTLPSLAQSVIPPSEIVFVRSADGKIDLEITLTVTEKGTAEQRFFATAQTPLEVMVKLEKPAKNVKGLFLFKSPPPQRQVREEASLSSLFASLLFPSPSFASSHDLETIEKRLVLFEFDYTDPEGDGIYTAKITTPAVDGEYEIITVIDYEDPDLGKKAIRLVSVIDPEGYVYERIKNQELRVTGAIVSLWWFNPRANQYELWQASEYQQRNPQITDVTGKYAFLVPQGTYYLKVEAPGYSLYDGKPFEVKTGTGVHTNIELTTPYSFIRNVDWKTILLILVSFLLIYNFYRDRIREAIASRKRA